MAILESNLLIAEIIEIVHHKTLDKERNKWYHTLCFQQ